MLTYWVVFVFLSLCEMFGAVIIYWFPYYYFVKLVFLVFAFHPETKGAEKVYGFVIKPFMDKHEKTINKVARATSQGLEKVTDLGKVRRVVVAVESISLRWPNVIIQVCVLGV